MGVSGPKRPSNVVPFPLRKGTSRRTEPAHSTPPPEVALPEIPRIRPVAKKNETFIFDPDQQELREAGNLGTFVSDDLATCQSTSQIDRTEAAQAIAFWRAHRSHDRSLGKDLIELGFGRMMRFLRYYPDRRSQLASLYGDPPEFKIALRLGLIAEVNEDIAARAFNAMSLWDGFPETERVFAELINHSFALKILLSLDVTRAISFLLLRDSCIAYGAVFGAASILFADRTLSEDEITKRDEIARGYFNHHGGMEKLRYYRQAAYWQRRIREVHKLDNETQWRELAQEMIEISPQLLYSFLGHGPHQMRIDIYIRLYHLGYVQLVQSLIDARLDRNYSVVETPKKSARRIDIMEAIEQRDRLRI